MGCGKSKHDDVATGNTTVVSRKKSVIDDADVVTRKNAETETVAVDETTESLGEQIKEGRGEEGHAEQLGGGGGNEENGGARLTSKESPNRFFSSRKEDQEESVYGSVVSEGKSEFLTPRQEKESVFSEKFEKVDEDVEESEAVVKEKEEENVTKEAAAEEKAEATIETEVLSLSAPSPNAAAAAAAATEKSNLTAEKVF